MIDTYIKTLSQLGTIQLEYHPMTRYMATLPDITLTDLYGGKLPNIAYMDTVDDAVTALYRRVITSQIRVGDREYAYRGGRFIEVYAVEIYERSETA